ncbi:MAG: hypothetical protein KA052_02460 [Candidatus Pacebacteria bacterium]|nr:hypothetical protein [Candidatus Paceibacterota bacterium]
MSIQNIDYSLIRFFQRWAIPVARFGLFVVFFWFGILKVIGLSPAGPLVENLFNHTIHFMSFPAFYLGFGLFEMLVGLLFLFRGAERIVLPLLLLHMIATCGPLFLIPEVTWSGFLVPTMEGQYIIKNLVIIACAMSIAAHLHPIGERKM